MGGNESEPDLDLLPPHLHNTDWVVDHSIDFIDDRQTDQPFCLWASFIDPHPPFIDREPYYSMYKDADIPAPIIPDWIEGDSCPSWLHNHRWMFNPTNMPPEQVRQARAVYYGMITHLDHQLGRLFGHLKAKGLWDNTVIIYTTDHGDHLGDFHCFHKHSSYEGAARVPYIVRFPKSFGFACGQQSNALVELADLYPTLLEIAGSPLPEHELDGRSLIPVLDGRNPKGKDFLHGQSVHNHMIRTPTHKYIYYGDDGCEQVFAMDGDRDERHDLSADQDLTTSLRQILIDHLQAENNPDFTNGQLINQGQGKKSIEELRSYNVLAMWN